MIYICIPTHNEQQTVGVVLWKLRQVLTEFPRDYQLLVADDASTDRTPDVLEPYTRVLPLTVIRNERRLGQAASLEMLLREAVRRSEYPKRDIVITLQADFSEEPDDIVPMIKRIEAGVDVVVGNKVSATKAPRTWRLARALGHFFTRSQQWPEGVESPFEGYRAYRLYGVKRAVDDRNGHRLVRYDGWAGHAELLRAVMPHARRIEAIDVEDRPDRLQRPRRERPFAAALQVRPMMQGTEPAGLTSVADLDRMAATASRSRDRTAPAPRAPGERGPQERTNGRSRQRGGDGQRRRDPRAEGQDRERAARPTAERPRRPAAEQRTTESRTAAQKPRVEAAPQQPRAAQSEQPRRPPRQKRTPDGAANVAQPEQRPAEVVEAETTDVTAIAGEAAQPTGETRSKRRRRKRKRSKASGATPSTDGQIADESADEAVPAEPQASGDADAEGESERSASVEGSSDTGERKRRRRRGGRGRRRGPRAGEAAAGTDTNATDDAANGEDNRSSNAPTEMTVAVAPTPAPTDRTED